MRVILSFLFVLAVLAQSLARADQTANPEFQAHFTRLCDLAAVKVRDENNKVPFFVDSYAVRALCVAYDMTGNTNYLDACRDWSGRMVNYQEKMIPRGAYYMHYNRKPGETTNDWYAADSSSIGMAVLATAVRCQGAEQKRYLKSAKIFADLVIKHYVKPSGGVSDGLWSKSSNEWWCSSGIFGSFLFNLYANTGDKRYLKTALGVTDWLNNWDLTKDQPFPLSQQGPAMLMYVMENYSAGWPYIVQDEARKKSAGAKVAWCLDWISTQQQKPLAERQWLTTVGWGMKFGGLPFHQYIFARQLPEDSQLAAAGDAELQRLEPIVFTGEPKVTQLPMFMLFSYAERLDPGDIYRSIKR
jgi:rhamnogalacturonyl hydrolase YesR